ncbi:MAG: hypothetical protein OWR62_10470 [Sulfobacillus thermotolerans]|nr:hypothetical protein [Sulfobacillus thermotolerans]
MTRNGPEQSAPYGPQDGGTGCSWIATTKSLTGGIGSNIMITVVHATQSLNALQSHLNTNNTSTWQLIKSQGIPLIEDGSAAYAIAHGVEVGVTADFTAQPPHQIAQEVAKVTTLIMTQLQHQNF